MLFRSLYMDEERIQPRGAMTEIRRAADAIITAIAGLTAADLPGRSPRS
mgnify:CR=1 FL=1